MYVCVLDTHTINGLGGVVDKMYGCMNADLLSFGLSVLKPLHGHHQLLLVHTGDSSLVDAPWRQEKPRKRGEYRQTANCTVVSTRQDSDIPTVAPLNVDGLAYVYQRD